VKHGLNRHSFSAKDVNNISGTLGRKLCVSKSSTADNLIFVSGLSGLNITRGKIGSNKFENQIVGCLNGVKTALEEADSSLDNLVKLVILIRNTESCPVMWQTMIDYCREFAPQLIKEPPAVTVIPVKDFLDPGCNIQMDSIAVVSQNKHGWKIKKFPLEHGTRPSTNSLPSKGRLLSESVQVGNLLFLSGVSGENPKTGVIDSDDFESQMDYSFEKISKAFDRAGSSACNIIKTLHMLSGMDDILLSSRDRNVSHSPASDRLWKRELEHYEMYAPSLLDDFPASTFLKLPSLETPRAMAEIDVTGVISLDEPGWEVKKYPLYYGKRGFPRHIGEIKKYYANTVVVGEIIFVSGQTPTDPFTGRIETDTIEEQVQVALDNLRNALEETGSSLNNLVKTYILMPDKENYSIFRALEREYYKKYAPALVKEPPAGTFIQPLNLASPKMMIEIEAIGFLPRR
jgi:2-iminobutanoate/2-iminopropanoate deaminase